MLHRILSQMHDLALFMAISIIFGIVRMLMVPEPGSLLHKMGALSMSAGIGTLAGAMAMQAHLGDYTVLTVCSVASLLSREILMAILNNRQYLGALLKCAMTNLMNKFTKPPL